MIMKFKPVYNFQSVEFEMEVNKPEDLGEGFKWYNAILNGLQAIAPEQPSNNAKAQPKEPLATEKQVATLVKLGVPEDEAKKMTVKQAVINIKKLIGEQ